MTDKQDDKLVIPCEVYSRIVGYVRPVAQWNKAKQNEFRDRVNYQQPTAGQLDAHKD